MRLSPQTGEVLARGPELHLRALQRAAGGSYRCVAWAPSVPGLNRSRLVNVAVAGEALWAPSGWPAGRGRGERGASPSPLSPGPPWMAQKERKVWVRQNALLNLSCEASGRPRPTISWNIAGAVSRRGVSPSSHPAGLLRPLNSAPSLQASEQDRSPHSVLSTLTVLVTPELLETGAECVASNALGRNSTTIVLALGKDRPRGGGEGGGGAPHRGCNWRVPHTSQPMQPPSRQSPTEPLASAHPRSAPTAEPTAPPQVGPASGLGPTVPGTLQGVGGGGRAGGGALPSAPGGRSSDGV